MSRKSYERRTAMRPARLGGKRPSVNEVERLLTWVRSIPGDKLLTLNVAGGTPMRVGMSADGSPSSLLHFMLFSAKMLRGMEEGGGLVIRVDGREKPDIVYMVCLDLGTWQLLSADEAWRSWPTCSGCQGGFHRPAQNGTKAVIMGTAKDFTP